jgi:hypothetical protein
MSNICSANNINYFGSQHNSLFDIYINMTSSAVPGKENAFTPEGLHFSRSTTPHRLDIAFDAATESSVKKISADKDSTQLKVGVSVLSEHFRKTTKLSTISSFVGCKNPGSFCLKNKNDPCCSTKFPKSKLCTDVFSCSEERYNSIEELRLKFFHPNISKKGRRAPLIELLKPMVKVSCFSAV